jgi:hypothetical protein
MTDESNANVSQDNSMPAVHGKLLIRWGLNLFVTGFLLGLVPVAHYIHGAVAGDIGAHFMKNMTLWWGCPAVLMELTLKTGGLGMIAIGFCYVALPRMTEAMSISSKESLAPKLCYFGLIAATIYAGVGYVVINMIWPNFFFEHNETGKNIWLAGQGIGITICIVGFFYALSGVKKNHLCQSI